MTKAVSKYTATAICMALSILIALTPVIAAVTPRHNCDMEMTRFMPGKDCCGSRSSCPGCREGGSCKLVDQPYQTFDDLWLTKDNRQIKQSVSSGMSGNPFRVARNVSPTLFNHNSDRKTTGHIYLWNSTLLI